MHLHLHFCAFTFTPYMHNVRNVPADTSLLKMCSQCPISKLHVGKCMQQIHGVIDVGTGYRDWLWLCFFSDAVNSTLKLNAQTAGTRRTTLAAIPLFKYSTAESSTLNERRVSSTWHASSRQLLATTNTDFRIPMDLHSKHGQE